MAKQIIMQYIDTKPGSADTLRVGFDKVNANFKLIAEKIKQPLRHIVWNDVSDSLKAAEDINYNFKIIESQLK